MFTNNYKSNGNAKKFEKKKRHVYKQTKTEKKEPE